MRSRVVLARSLADLGPGDHCHRRVGVVGVAALMYITLCEVSLVQWVDGAAMQVDEILDQYNLTRETAARYIEAIVQMNQSQTAEEIDVSRPTINRYKNVFNEMSSQERLIVISTLAQEQLLDRVMD